MADKMSKKIKFALFLKDDEEVRTLAEFEEFFSMTEVIEYFLDGKLLKWLRSHDYPEAKCAVIDLLYKRYKKSGKKVSGAEKSSEEIAGEIIKQLSNVFDEIPDEKKLGATEIKNIQLIEKRLAKEDYILDTVEFEDDEEDEVLKDVGTIARDQAELDEILKKFAAQKLETGGEKTKKQKKSSNIVYMIEKDSPYTLRKEDVFNNSLRFIGLNRINFDEETQIEILETSEDGEDRRVEDKSIKKLIKDFRNANQNKAKFNNLVILTRKRDGIGDDDFIDYLYPVAKVAVKSADSEANKSGMEIAEDHLSQYLDAGFPLIYIDTFEEEKADEFIVHAAVGRDIYEWSEAERLFQRDSKGNIISHFDRRFSLQEVLQHFIDDYRRTRGIDSDAKCDLSSSILVLKDTNDHLNNFEVTSQLKYLAQLIYNGQIEDCNIVIISSVWNIPSTLEHYLTMMKIKLTKDDIANLIINFCKNHGVSVPSDMLIKKFVTAFNGLSEFNIINILSLAFSIDGDLNPTDLDLVVETKKQIIQKANILEMIEVSEDEDDIGGLEILKDWLKRKEKIFKNISFAEDCGVKVPKGILIVGMPGCGKTLTAKVTSAIFDMPLLRLDMGRIFGKYVGESEKNMRRATQQAEVVAPCVLWIDEFEKAFAGVGGKGGAEVATRLFGTFLTWMQEKTAPVFVVATANNVSQLPPELLRKGRFDEIFYVGTPNAVERRKILEIYIGKIESNENFKYERTDDNFDEIVEKTLGCSGADLAGIISESVERSFIESISAKKTANEKTKPVFRAEIVQAVINDMHKMSGWQQLQKILQTYRQSKYKNASHHDAADFYYWLKLRAINLKSLPGKFVSLLKGIGVGFSEGTNSLARKKLGKLSDRVKDWKNEESQIKEGILDKKLPWHFRFCRGVVKTLWTILNGLNNFIRRHWGKKKVNLQKGGR